jgi:hypothetical protein
MSDISDYTILIKSGQFLQKNTAIHGMRLSVAFKKRKSLTPSLKATEKTKTG